MENPSDTGSGIGSSIGICLAFGTIGWFVVSFGTMTDCTNTYGCTETGCAPCATTELWINAGAVVQWILAGVGVGVVARAWVRGLRGKRSNLAVPDDALFAMSLLTTIATTWLARQAY